MIFHGFKEDVYITYCLLTWLKNMKPYWLSLSTRSLSSHIALGHMTHFTKKHFEQLSHPCWRCFVWKRHKHLSVIFFYCCVNHIKLHEKLKAHLKAMPGSHFLTYGTDFGVKIDYKMKYLHTFHILENWNTNIPSMSWNLHWSSSSIRNCWISFFSSTALNSIKLPFGVSNSSRFCDAPLGSL